MFFRKKKTKQNQTKAYTESAFIQSSRFPVEKALSYAEEIDLELDSPEPVDAPASNTLSVTPTLPLASLNHLKADLESQDLKPSPFSESPADQQEEAKPIEEPAAPLETETLLLHQQQSRISSPAINPLDQAAPESTAPLALFETEEPAMHPQSSTLSSNVPFPNPFDTAQPEPSNQSATPDLPDLFSLPEGDASLNLSSLPVLGESNSPELENLFSDPPAPHSVSSPPPSDPITMDDILNLFQQQSASVTEPDLSANAALEPASPSAPLEDGAFAFENSMAAPAPAFEQDSIAALSFSAFSASDEQTPPPLALGEIDTSLEMSTLDFETQPILELTAADNTLLTPPLPEMDFNIQPKTGMDLYEQDAFSTTTTFESGLKIETFEPLSISSPSLSPSASDANPDQSELDIAFTDLALPALEGASVENDAQSDLFEPQAMALRHTGFNSAVQDDIVAAPNADNVAFDDTPVDNALDTTSQAINDAGLTLAGLDFENPLTLGGSLGVAEDALSNTLVQSETTYLDLVSEPGIEAQANILATLKQTNEPEQPYSQPLLNDASDLEHQTATDDFPDTLTITPLADNAAIKPLESLPPTQAQPPINPLVKALSPSASGVAALSASASRTIAKSPQEGEREAQDILAHLYQPPPPVPLPGVDAPTGHSGQHRSPQHVLPLMAQTNATDCLRVQRVTHQNAVAPTQLSQIEQTQDKLTPIASPSNQPPHLAPANINAPIIFSTTTAAQHQTPMSAFSPYPLNQANQALQISQPTSSLLAHNNNEPALLSVAEPEPTLTCARPAQDHPVAESPLSFPNLELPPISVPITVCALEQDDLSGQADSQTFLIPAAAKITAPIPSAESTRILAIQEITPSQQIMLVEHGNQFALMVDENERTTLIKAFNHNPLADSRRFDLTQEAILNEKTLYLMQVGHWMAIMAYQNGTLTLQTEI